MRTSASDGAFQKAVRKASARRCARVAETLVAILFFAVFGLLPQLLISA
jgi:hypothetical protein